MLRIMPAAALVLAASSFAAAPGPAHAAEGPWCAVTEIGPTDIARNCGFFSFQRCVAEVISGNRGFCEPNPDFHGPLPQPEHWRRHSWRGPR
ncbi:MAG TPA: DUF3551 domain-containing protein [Pseudolabrys sp.]|nr:DUF3551 domain-containing protein [Pseudolabrys sp.]